MSTVAQLVDRARRDLHGGHRESVNRLLSGVDAVAIELPMSFTLAELTPGSDIEIDSEVIHVWSIDAQTGSTVDVARGWDGTTAAAHAANSTVRVNPRFRTVDLVQALIDEVHDLNADPGLFRMKSTTLTYRHGVSYAGFDVSTITDMEAPYSIDGDQDAVYGWDRANNVIRGRYWRTAETFQYKAKYGVPTALTDNLQSATIGLPVSLEDAVVWGMQVRRMATREARLGFPDSQGEPRRASETPVGSTRSAIALLSAMREERVRSEVVALMQQYPMRRKGA